MDFRSADTAALAVPSAAAVIGPGNAVEEPAGSDSAALGSRPLGRGQSSASEPRARYVSTGGRSGTKTTIVLSSATVDGGLSPPTASSGGGATTGVLGGAATSTLARQQLSDAAAERTIAGDAAAVQEESGSDVGMLVTHPSFVQSRVASPPRTETGAWAIVSEAPTGVAPYSSASSVTQAGTAVTVAAAAQTQAQVQTYAENG